MANALNPTAANIISSLGVKGATAEGGEGFSGYVPMLDENGKLALSFIPAGAAAMAMPPLHDVAFVDPFSEAETPTGSIAAPFRTLSEAASAASALLLAPGTYNSQEDGLLDFSGRTKAYIIGLGPCVLGQSSTATMISADSGASVYIQNVTAGSVSVSQGASVTCMSSRLVSLGGSEGVTVRLSDDSYVESVGEGVSVQYISEASGVGYGGGTVKDALDVLLPRKIKLRRISAGSSGFDVGSSYYVDAESFDSFQAYNLADRDASFVRDLNRMLSTGKDLSAETLSVDSVTAKSAFIERLSATYLNLSGYKLEVDPYGYLVATDGHVPGQTSGTILIKDSDTGVVYRVGMRAGRLYVEEAEVGSSSSYPEVIRGTDDAGNEFDFHMLDGRLVMVGEPGSGSGPYVPGGVDGEEFDLTTVAGQLQATAAVVHALGGTYIMPT